MDPDDPPRIAPDLAERWDVSADGLLYTFRLRQGVRWHDGQPFTTADVKATLDRLLDPSSGARAVARCCGPSSAASRSWTPTR